MGRLDLIRPAILGVALRYPVGPMLYMNYSLQFLLLSFFGILRQLVNLQVRQSCDDRVGDLELHPVLHKKRAQVR